MNAITFDYMEVCPENVIPAQRIREIALLCLMHIKQGRIINAALTPIEHQQQPCRANCKLPELAATCLCTYVGANRWLIIPLHQSCLWQFTEAFNKALIAHIGAINYKVWLIPLGDVRIIIWDFLYHLIQTRGDVYEGMLQ